MAKGMMQVLYCEECHFNYPIGTAGIPKCPDCGKRLTVVNCKDEAKLIAFIEDLKKKREEQTVSDDIKPTIHNVKINDIIEGICKKREESFKFEVRAIETNFESLVIIYDFRDMDMCYTDFSGVKEFTEWLRPIKGTNQAEVMLGVDEDDNINTEDT